MLDQVLGSSVIGVMTISTGAFFAASKSNGYGFMPEVTLLVMAAGMKVQEVPITFTGRERGESKMGTMQIVNGLGSFLFNLLQYRLRMGRYSRRLHRDNPLA